MKAFHIMGSLVMLYAAKVTRYEGETRWKHSSIAKT